MSIYVVRLSITTLSFYGGAGQTKILQCGQRMIPQINLLISLAMTYRWTGFNHERIATKTTLGRTYYAMPRFVEAHSDLFAAPSKEITFIGGCDRHGF